MLVLLSRIALAVVLALVVDNVDGNQRIVYVIEPFTDNGGTVTNSGDGGNVISSLLCCMYGNCSCYSFDDALGNLTSNVLLNITTDVVLSSLINASNLENISIIGHNNPTVNCKRAGGIHFTFCNNCIIQGITWDGCGAFKSRLNTAPALKLNYSSNITIQNCSFQHSKGQAVVLSDISGDVNVNHCKFVNNTYYRGHGVAISYSSNNIMNHPIPFLFQICNCNFTHNEGAESFVYIENRMTGISNSITLCDSIFYHNQGVSIYVVNQKLYLNGKNLLENNTAQKGVGIYISDLSTVIFGRNSYAAFIQNSAHDYGGAIYSANNGNIFFKDNSTTMFINNHAFEGGAIYGDYESTISFEDSSTTTFSNNNAVGGGAVYYRYASISFKDNSTIVFSNNNARDGGAVFSHYGTLSFEDNSTTVFSNNIAISSSGAIFINGRTISFEDNSVTMFSNNNAIEGGAVYGRYASISFKDNCTTVFSNNNASDGGAIYLHTVYSDYRSTISFGDNSTAVFNYNTANNRGGVIYSVDSNITFEDNSTTEFNNNAGYSAGVIYSDEGSTVSFKNHSATNFNSNNAVMGGSLFIDCGSVTFEDNSTTVFSNNNASVGGGIYSNDGSTTTFENNSTIRFNNNYAINEGAAIYSYDCKILEENPYSSVFSNNTSANGGTVDSFKSYSFVSKLQLYNPAICIDDKEKKECSQYYIYHVMLGQDIIIPACALDYCNNTVDSKVFLLRGEGDNYNISDSNILLSCDFIGTSIRGYPPLSKPFNYSITIESNNDHNSEWKQISVNLIVELLPCYPGFWQYPGSEKCECYHDNDNDIVFCSDSSSTIKRGYWFGFVGEMPTVTFCPINYCNFTCCETSNGYYHLSPVRDDQCRSHRSGTACGSCTDGYTLSFDSPECVSIESCTASQTVLVTLLTVTYWIAIVALVFAMMYFKVGIGYLYSITYYYSIVNILLKQNLYASRGLYLTVSVLSSFSKITPQFLGELCLTTGMSGIDQQIIHYIHPSAVIAILVMICLLARRSRRFSSTIRCSIIHIICCLLLLSYTSVASTSLLLMRPLKFHQIDKVYTYLSPDIEYFHGRHLAYGIVALLITVSLVLGLPLLLTFEPFINHKINFIKIKPLLDQFQGCYKDKYRCFASYYMICRIVIISIVITNSSNEFVANYVLITVCGIIALIHLTVKPYNNEVINKFDGVVLQLMILIAVLPLLDDFDSPFVIATAFTFIILPLLNFIAMTLFLHKDDLKRVVTHCTTKEESPSSNNDASNNETPMRGFDLIIDDSMRKNAIICDV